MTCVIMKLSYLRRLLTLLAFFDVLVFKSVGTPLESNTLVSGEEEILPTTNKPPEVLILKADFCEELTKCPDTDKQIQWRKPCFKEACPDDKVYHCGVAENRRTIVEFCYPHYPCDKGYYGSPEVYGKSVKVACKMCPAGRFNPERRWSPGNMDSCRTHLHIPAEPHTILFRPGNSTDPAVYFCDATNGWASAHKSFFCKPSYQPCSCTYQEDSCPGEELLPDMRCVPKCEGQRLPEKNFGCVQSTESAITTTEPIGGTSTVGTSTAPSTSSSAGDDSTSPPLSRSDYDFKDYLTFGLLCGSIVILLILTIVCYKKRSFCCKITKTIWNYGGDHNDARHAKNVNMNKRADQESASSLFTNGIVDNADTDVDSEHRLLGKTQGKKCIN